MEVRAVRGVGAEVDQPVTAESGQAVVEIEGKGAVLVENEVEYSCRVYANSWTWEVLTIRQ